MALDEPTRALVDQLTATGAPPLHELDPETARGNTAALVDLQEPGPEVERVQEVTLTGPDGGSFPVRVLVPAGTPTGMLVWLHGGGWVIGGIDQVDAPGRRIAVETGCVVVLVGYRKAPEHPYPTPVEDAWTALTWAAEARGQLAGPEVPLLVGGESAGGNLAAVLARRSVERGGPTVARQVLVYPVTDSDLDLPSYHDPANQLMLTRDGMAWFWNHYAPTGRRTEPDASPLRAATLAGVAPALVVLAEHDPLLDEGLAYAEALARSGVAVRHRTFAGQMHGFFSLTAVLPAAREAVDLVCTSITDTVGAQEAATR